MKAITYSEQFEKSLNKHAITARDVADFLRYLTGNPPFEKMHVYVMNCKLEPHKENKLMKICTIKFSNANTGDCYQYTNSRATDFCCSNKEHKLLFPGMPPDSINAKK